MQFFSTIVPAAILLLSVSASARTVPTAPPDGWSLQMYSADGCEGTAVVSVKGSAKVGCTNIKANTGAGSYSWSKGTKPKKVWSVRAYASPDCKGAHENAITSESCQKKIPGKSYKSYMIV